MMLFISVDKKCMKNAYSGFQHLQKLYLQSSFSEWRKGFVQNMFAYFQKHKLAKIFSYGVHNYAYKIRDI